MTENIEIRSPSNLKVIGTVKRMSKDEVRGEIEEAYKGFEEISKMPLYKRTNILRKVSEIIEREQERLARLLATEAGKPIKDSRVEVLRASRLFRQAAEEASIVLEGKNYRVDAYEYPPGNENRIVISTREPIGVVTAILPFNFPINSFAHKVAPAIAVGNSVVVKPSINTPLSAIEMKKILVEAGLPDSAVRIVTGYSNEIGDEIITHPLVGLITLTGSTQTGLSIASKAVALGKRIIMELGGSDPIIVLEDANIDRASSIAVRARFEYAGQNCNAGKRIIVRQEIADKFAKAFYEKVKSLRVGDPLDETTDVGPVINRESVEKLNSVLEDAKIKGGKVEILNKGSDSGYFFPLSVITNANLDMLALKTEVFGPIAPIVSVKNDEEAISIANSTEYGLQSAIFSNDLNRALKISRQLKFGAVIINDSTRLRWDSLPFGGFKKTGIGREGVRETMIEMTENKLIAITLF
ncbi:aldehyde dehydrogenase [Sulfolobus sp. A20]|nr:aldehyde dehydrogenase [Sulfolobus sp. A20]TRM75685.1 aldehyde dehydrogenase [Sulfolobus sp. A20-N-F8]TRM78214.1 aldehyde dehydrogenase [Sulfolobus sp. B5]TRM84037.1 aldehyde dehydrogenase [Sulfolobus sp. A20-N-F6]TRM86610.1 aldehyde dehydrogenase [Sulfolobus sp. E3]TRM86884.1 aldehyde dehydrogenase [Sulfolobus sp. C3]TRM97140.1 aldehyde dehydrogenase [Sulfolobus sp. B1]TRN03444.1 aldehyde dehydrogenase [Sulfolobus sp. F1]TRN03625.1 aldehyde dehydrogenase [Sulfolobus sp. E1]